MGFFYTVILFCGVALSLARLQTKRAGSIVVSAITISVVIGVVVTAFYSFTIVPSGHAGVGVVFGKVRPVPYPEGLHLKLPWEQVQAIETRLITIEEDLVALSADQQKVTIHLKVTYQRLANETPLLFDEVATSAEEELARVIGPATHESLKAQVALHDVAELLEKRQAIKDDIQRNMTDWCARYHLVLREVSISNISFSPAYDQAIEAKQVVEQEIGEATNQLARMAEQVAQKVNLAKGEADAAIATAQGNAAQIRQLADAEAEAIRVKTTALVEQYRLAGMSYSPLLAQRDYTQTWDGKLPVFMGGPNAGGNSPAMMFNIPLQGLLQPPASSTPASSTPAAPTAVNTKPATPPADNTNNAPAKQ